MELRRDEAASSDSQRQTEQKADENALEGAAEDQLQYFAAIGAEGHANPDLMSSLGHGVGSDTIETPGGKQQCHHAE